jgi:hypothetical protein
VFDTALLVDARSRIAEWAAEAPPPVRAALDARRAAPDHLAVPAEATIRRTLSRLDADALAAAVGAWPADRERDRPRPAASRWRAVAVGRKTLRGACTQAAGGDGRPVHLLAAMDHTTRAVLAQRQIGGAPRRSARSRIRTDAGPHVMATLLAQPGHRRAVPDRAGQRRCRTPPPRPRPTPDPSPSSGSASDETDIT